MPVSSMIRTFRETMGQLRGKVIRGAFVQF